MSSSRAIAAAEATTTRQLLESQRDEALGRAAKAEEALAAALNEQRSLSERLTRITLQSADERTLLEMKVTP